jgi:hypothetical protein
MKMFQIRFEIGVVAKNNWSIDLSKGNDSYYIFSQWQYA